MFQIVRNIGDNIITINIAQFGVLSLHEQAVVEEIEIDIQIGQRWPFRLEFECGMTQGHPDLELPFVLFEREVMRIAVEGQRSVIHLTAFNRAGQIIHQMFTHQVFREVAPRLSGVVQTDTSQNIQPRLAFCRLSIVEITLRPQRIGFDVNVFTGQRPPILIVRPVERPGCRTHIQRRAEHLPVRQQAVLQFDV